MRIAALLQIIILVFIAFVVLTRAGLMFNEYFELSGTVIWFVVAFCLVSAVLNVITPSKRERMLWAPITIVLLICSVVVALS